MNRLVDHIAVAAIVLGALLFFSRRFIFRRSRKSCDSGCGCSVSKPGLKPRV